ncbi:MAG: short-chain dehydrogenase/reductase [Candidatus Nitrosopolaris wilkensis]|nr:MAG: short-chain dehydrogenase/reductase [Candidatus Nitrosopolaris wilkensis]
MASSLSASQKVVVVTGSSSGIGYETSLTLSRNGFLTYATMRNLNKSENIKSLAEKEKLPLKLIELDVTDDGSVKNAIQSIKAEANRIDVLVNNAGYGVNGAFEDLAMEEIRAQYETNLFGVIRVTQAVLPIMRKQKSGIIVNISSGAGRFGYPGGSAYVSTKFAIEGLSESMSYELEPFGIRVVLVEPGVIRTNFVNSMVAAKKSQDPNSPYSQLMKNVATSFQQMLEGGSSSDVVAKVVLKAVTSENPSLRYLAGKDVETWLDGKRNMSDEEFYKMMKQNLMK